MSIHEHSRTDVCVKNSEPLGWAIGSTEAAAASVTRASSDRPARQLLDYLAALYPPMPGAVAVAVVRRGNGPALTRRIVALEGDDYRERLAFAVAELEGEAERRKASVKIAVAPRRAGFEADRPKGSHGQKADVAALGFVWLDVDLGTVGHAAEGLPPDDGAAWLELVGACGLPRPSLAVHSGGGIHAYWRLSDPLRVDDDRPVWAALRDRLEAAGRATGYVVDVGPLHSASLLAVPGTENRKPDAPARPVQLLWADGGAYSLAELEIDVERQLQRSRPLSLEPRAPLALSADSSAAVARHVDAAAERIAAAAPGTRNRTAAREAYRLAGRADMAAADRPAALSELLAAAADDHDRDTIRRAWAAGSAALYDPTGEPVDRARLARQLAASSSIPAILARYALEHDQRPPRADSAEVCRLVFVALARAGEGRPSIMLGADSLAASTGFRRPTVLRSLSRLEKAGLIELVDDDRRRRRGHARTWSIPEFVAEVRAMGKTEPLSSEGLLPGTTNHDRVPDERGTLLPIARTSATFAPSRHDAAVHPLSVVPRPLSSRRSDVRDAYAALPDDRKPAAARGLGYVLTLRALSGRRGSERSAVDVTAALEAAGYRRSADTTRHHLARAVDAGAVRAVRVVRDDGAWIMAYRRAGRAYGTGGPVSAALAADGARRAAERAEAARQNGPIRNRPRLESPPPLAIDKTTEGAAIVAATHAAPRAPSSPWLDALERDAWMIGAPSPAVVDATKRAQTLPPAAPPSPTTDHQRPVAATGATSDPSPATLEAIRASSADALEAARKLATERAAIARSAADERAAALEAERRRHTPGTPEHAAAAERRRLERLAVAV